MPAYILRAGLQAVGQFDAGERDFSRHPQRPWTGTLGVDIGGVVLLRFGHAHRDPGFIEELKSPLVSR